MELAGINSSTTVPEGGEIVCDKRGRPIGVFRETATGLFGEAQRQYETRQAAHVQENHTRTIVQLALQDCLSKGITSFHDAGATFEFANFLRVMALEDQLPLRLYLMLAESNSSLARRLPDHRWLNLGNHKLTVRSIKRLVDGALGAHGAWLLAPYEDLDNSVGLNTTSLEYLSETAELAIENDFQLCVHAIGDRANREILNLFEETFQRHSDKQDLRWRIEHAQHLSAPDIPRFKALGVIASMQPIHATSDGPWAVRRLGASRAEEGAYVWRRLLDAGAVIAGGTDAPVEDVDPIKNFHAAITRQMADGTTFYPGQCMTREEALRSLTLDCAYAAFEEANKGSLTPGKLADITILSQDIMSIPEEKILETEVVHTIVGGQVTWSADR
jgi:predicted amidohydrolase YtcJ